MEHIRQRVEKQVLRPCHSHYSLLRGFCHLSKNLYNHANYEVRQAFIKEGRWIRYKKLDWELNHRGEMHGGATATMFDLSMGMTVSAFAGGENVTTTDITVSYIRPFFGDSFDFEVEVLHIGKSLIRVRSIARDTQTGKEMASAIANYAHMHDYDYIAEL